jgi:hypothetical protein
VAQAAAEYGKPVFALTPMIATACGELAAGVAVLVADLLFVASRMATGRIEGSST